MSRARAIIKKLKKEYPRKGAPPRRGITCHLAAAVIGRDAESNKAYKACENALDEFVDWNELRVARWGEVERQPLRSVRRATAKHMARAWSQIPHVSHQDVADVTKLEALRQKQKDRIAAQGGSLTLTVFVLKAAVAALKAYPRFNASLDVAAQEIILKNHYHIGVAVDTERGLLVPVLHDVDRKSVAELAIEMSDLVARTRAGKVSLEELQGGTFTITNPGPLGGTGFAAIVNYPEVAILGMARASWQPVVRGKGKKATIVPRFILPLVLSFDHRVVDGADAARFVNLIVELLQDPGRLLMGL
jgi:pyruvate dehydrogenase E2 component (dihydrolipoamide acetyltransferase)